MTSLSERLLVVRPQWEAQLDAFRTLTTRALDSTEQLLALNMKTSRASIEQATGTLQQMLHASSPQDLFAIGTQAQDQWRQAFSYSRELMGIAMGARQSGWSTLPVHDAPALLPAPVLRVLTQSVQQTVERSVEQAGIAVADAATVTGEIVTAAAESNAALAEDTLGVGDQSGGGASADAGLAPAGQIEPAAASVDVADETPAEMPAETSVETPTELDAEKTGAAPSEVPGAASDTAQSASAVLDEETSANVDALVDIVIADDVPPGKTKPLVEALHQVVPKPASAEHPIISTVPLEAGAHVELPLVTPAEATPPVQLSNGPAPAEGRRNSRKKS